MSDDMYDHICDLLREFVKSRDEVNYVGDVLQPFFIKIILQTSAELSPPKVQHFMNNYSQNQGLNV